MYTYLSIHVYVIILHVYINILHVYIIILHVYIIMFTCIHIYLACIHKYLACIHNWVYKYTHLSSHVHIIRYTNNTYVLLQMLQVSLQHCCWASYQIAEQVTIWWLCVGRGGLLDNDLESKRRPGPGEGTQSMKVTIYAPLFWPPFSGLWEFCMVSTPIVEQNVLFRHPFCPFVTIWVNGRCWASLSETQPRTHIPVRLCRGSPVNMCGSRDIFLAQSSFG